jgi:DNA-binding GntR family transcriptional regulator
LAGRASRKSPDSRRLAGNRSTEFSINVAHALGLPSRGSVIAITRTCLAAGKPYETADIVLRSDRCELHYELGER